MNFSLTSTHKIIPKDLHTAYEQTIREEINSRDPAQGARLMKENVAEQLQFSFTSSKKS